MAGRLKGLPKTGGRQKGTLNKVTATVKQNTLQVFDRLGGTDQMLKWAEHNLTEFYRHYVAMARSDPDAQGGTENPI
jgi:hypothetical protein